MPKQRKKTVNKVSKKSVKKPIKKTTKKKGTKKKLNEYFKLMLDAKKKKLEEFTYKGKKYVRKVSKSPRSGAELIVYKKK